MKKIIFVCFFATLLCSCSVVSFLKKNCTIETQISGSSFICLKCNFDNASPELKKQLDKKIETFSPNETR